MSHGKAKVQEQDWKQLDCTGQLETKERGDSLIRTNLNFTQKY